MDDEHAEKILKDTDYQMLFYYDREAENTSKKGSEESLRAMLTQRTHDRQVIWLTDIELPPKNSSSTESQMKVTVGSSIWINDYVRKEQIPHVSFD